MPPKKEWPECYEINEGGCWVWVASLDKDGYGCFRHRRAHRLVYEALVGPIPDGLEIDHLCRNRACVNPEHMEPVTHYTNTMRGIGVAVINAAKTHCVNGHPFTEENTYTYFRKGLPQRQCRTCRAYHSANRRRP